MVDHVYQKIQFIGTSSTSLSDAIAAAVAKAATIIKNASWFEVVEERGAIVDGKIREFQVTVLVGGRVE
jgi:flavin-binding protein dodecin